MMADSDKRLDDMETDAMVPSSQYVAQHPDDDPETASEETNHPLHHLRVNVSRPVYTQQDFDEENEPHPRYHATVKDWFKAKLKRNQCSGTCFKRNLYKYFPFTKIMQGYNPKRDLFSDLIAGLTVGIMHLPQGMAYGLLANLSPVYGLYTSFFPVLFYFFFGTSRHVSKGTFAVVSLMVGAVVDKGNCSPSPLNSQSSTNGSSTALNNSIANTTESPMWMDEELMCKVGIATSTTFAVGVIHIFMGIMKLGFVSIYLSDPLTRGFTTATAVHVVTSQMKHMFGVPVDRFSGPFKIIYQIQSNALISIARSKMKKNGVPSLTLHFSALTWGFKLSSEWYIDFFRKISMTNIASLIMCILCMAIMFLTKEYINPRVKAKIKMPVPIELIVIIISTLMSYLANFEEKFSMIVVGDVPTGIPAPRVPPIGLRFGEVFFDAIGIALVTFAVDLAMGKLLANKHNYRVEANQELRASGISITGSSFFGCFVAPASLSRSLIQEGVGGVTQVAGLFSCLLLLLVLLFVGPLFEQLPNNVLAATVIVNLKGMFLQFSDLKVLWKASKTDMMIWLVVFLATVIIDVDLGLFIGLGFSLLTVVYRTQAPHTSLLGRVPDTDIYKDIAIYNSSKEIPGLKIFRFECSLVYANVEHFVKKLYKKTVNPWSLKRLKEKKDHQMQVTEVNNHNANEQENETEVAVINHTEVLVDPAVTLTYDLNTPKVIVMDCSAIADVDYPGANGIIKVIREFKQVDVEVMLAACKASVREMIEAAGFHDAASIMYLSVHDAVVAALHKYPQLRNQSLSDGLDSGSIPSQTEIECSNSLAKQRDPLLGTSTNGV